MFRPDIVPAAGVAVREVLDAAVPTHPAKCVFIVNKKLVIILIMIKSLLTIINLPLIIFTEMTYEQRGNYARIYHYFRWLQRTRGTGIK